MPQQGCAHEDAEKAGHCSSALGSSPTKAQQKAVLPSVHLSELFVQSPGPDNVAPGQNDRHLRTDLFYSEF